MENDEHLPIIKSFFDPQALAQRITGAYRLSGVRCQLIKATMRDVYHVTSREGSFIGLVYQARHSPQSIREEIELTDYLTQAGLRVVTAVRQRNQEYLIALDGPEGVRHLILLPYVPGTVSRKPSPTLLGRYGALVAELHRLTDALPEPQARPTYDAETLIVQCVTTLEGMTGYLETVFDEIRTIADRIYPLLQALPKTGPQFGIVHGDIIPSNALIGPNDTLTLIDFDLFGLSWRSYDIASYLNEIGFWQMGLDAAKTFLDGYTSVRSLTEQETQTLPLMQIARHLASLGTAAANVNTWGSAIYLSDRVIDVTLNAIRELSARLA